MANRKIKIPALAMTLFFSFGFWCADITDARFPTLTSPHSGFQCSLGFFPGSSSKSILTFSRTDGFIKGGQVHVRESLPSIFSEEIFVSGHKTAQVSQMIFPEKVPIYLINSVLTI